mgnify:CR=1 FL=1
MPVVVPPEVTYRLKLSIILCIDGRPYCDLGLASLVLVQQSHNHPSVMDIFRESGNLMGDLRGKEPLPLVLFPLDRHRDVMAEPQT